MEIYQHVPLQTQRSIRVLRLAPSVNHDSQIHGQLVEVSLDNNPKYEALSYVWGSRQPERYIECHGLKLCITANCEAALRRLRNRCCPRNLWIDAICINQTSIPEKNIQLRLMAEVYRKSRRVLVWLSEGSLTLDRTFGSFRTFELLKKMRLPEQVLRRYLERLILKNIQWSVDITLEPFVQDYFVRVWTIQEIALAQQASVICGRVRISWQSLVSICSYFHKQNLLTKSSLEAKAWAGLAAHFLMENRQWSTASVLHKRNRSLEELYEPPDFLRALEYAKYLDATNAKDKVYGLFWTLGDLDIMKADYAKSVQQIYLETSSAVITKLGTSARSLDLLIFVNSYGRQPDLPSWVVDWSDPKPFEISSSDFQASRINENSRPRVIEGQGMLEVFGCSFDQVEHREGLLNHSIEMGRLPEVPHLMEHDPEMLSTSPDHAEQIEGIRRWISNIFTISEGHDEQQLYPTGVSQLIAFMSCLILGDDSQYHWAASDFSQKWIQLLNVMDPQLDSQLWIEDVISLLEEIMPHLGDLSLVLRRTVSFNPNPERSPSAQRIWGILAVLTITGLIGIHRYTLKLNTGRAFFTTSAGYMGSAFHTIQEGDTVALFAGARHPMIIRRVGEYYHLVGPAYIHGIMYGEAWPKDERSLSKFTLI